MTSTAHIHSVTPIKLPIGVGIFSHLLEEGYSFIDKSLLIKDFLDSSATVTLITRPRRFGKTLNLTMLRYFFAPQVIGRPTTGLFQNLAIASDAEAMAHQGKHPVMFLSLKDLSYGSFEDFEASLRVKFARLVGDCRELKHSPHLEKSEHALLEALLYGRAERSVMQGALRLLSELLYRHHGQKVVILIDEYETPLLQAAEGGYAEELMLFLRPMLSAALQGNDALYKGALTGILSMGKESLFSDLNHLAVHTVLDAGYSQYFGFTEAEVAGLLQASGLAAHDPALEEKIQHEYRGYQIGGEMLYNPWSIIQCLRNGGELEPYWAHTGGNAPLVQATAAADKPIKQALERLIQGESIEACVDPSVNFKHWAQEGATLWGLMLASGYLTALSVETAGQEYRCRLTLPNQELHAECNYIIKSWFSGPANVAYRTMLFGLMRGHTEAFETGLRECLSSGAPCFDASGQDPESLILTLILGLRVDYDLRTTYVIASHCKGDEGSRDLALIPRCDVKHKAAERVGVVLAFSSSQAPAALQITAEAALAHIDVQRYEAELAQHPVERLLRIGLAFCGHEVAVAYGRCDKGIDAPRPGAFPPGEIRV